MKDLVTSDFKLGVIAGGQLAKMMALAASNWDVKTYILDKDEHCPASPVCAGFTKGDPQNFDDVYNFGKSVDLLTYEMEAINIEALKKLHEEKYAVCPSVYTLETIQDKGLQKEFYKKHNLPTSDFQLFADTGELRSALTEGSLQYPFVQKLRKGGYDGRGVAVIKNEDDLPRLLEGPCLAETLVDIAKEISVIAARNQSGEIKCFPVVEMEFNPEANLVERLVCPAALSEELEKQAFALATSVIESFQMAGLLAIEMFINQQGEVLVNEVAPRTHNSGHHTIESVVTSQFEQMLRAIFDLPLGSTRLKLPAVMINLLGEPGHQGPVKYEGLTEAMAVAGTKLHLYGKRETRPFRKMGHVTVVAQSLDEAKSRADQVKHILKVIT